MEKPSGKQKNGANMKHHEILNNFEYVDGILYCKKPRGKLKVGDVVGTYDDGYFYVGFNYKRYLSHRIIFMMFHGYMPKIVDHIDGNPSNNKIENLRESTQQQNCFNSKLSKANKSGVKGVNWHKLRNKWKVEIRVNGIKKHFGLFQDLELAELVANEARRKFHKEFANNGTLSSNRRQGNV